MQFKSHAWFQASAVKEKNYTLLDYYAGSIGNFLPTFWDNVSVPSLRFKNPKVLFDS